MDNMNERQKAFEKKFAHDAEMLFKAKEAGDDDVVEKIMSDAAEKGVTLDQAKVKEKSAELLGLAKAELADGE